MHIKETLLFYKNTTIIMGFAMLALFMAFSIWSNYISTQELQEASLNQFREYSAREATTFSHFFQERKNDMADIADSRELMAYFANKALGMSMEYGLSASLLGVSEYFKHVVERKKINGVPLYSRIAFVDTRGDVLASDKFLATARNNGGIVLPLGRNPGGPHILFEKKGDIVNIVLALPYSFKGQTVGTILAWINVKEIQPLLTEAVSEYKICGFSFLVCGKSYCSPQKSIPEQLSKDITDGRLPVPGRIVEATLALEPAKSLQKTLVVVSRIEGTQFSLASIASKKDVVGTNSPATLMGYTLMLAALLIGSGVIALRTGAKNLVLNARIQEEARHSKTIESKNIQLEREVEARVEAESALRQINDELELRIQQRTLALTKEVQERREAESAVRLIFNNTHDAIFIHNTDGIIIDINETMLEMYGVSKDDVLGCSLFENLSGPGMDARILHGYWEQARKGEEVLFGWMARRPGDGRLFDVEVAFNKIELSGQTVILANVHDISELKKIQAQQEEHQEFLTTIFEGIGAAIFVFDPENGVMIDCNAVAEHMLDMSSDDISRSICNTKQYFTSDKEKDLLCPDWNEHGTYEEGILAMRDASPLPVSRQLFEVNMGGKTHLVQVVFDIAERKTLERKLNVAQKLESIGLLASGVAHEINTPIQYIGDSIRFVKETYADTIELIALYETLITTQSPRRREEIAENLREFKEKIDFDFIMSESTRACDRALEGTGRVATIVQAMKNFSHPGDETFKAVDLNKAIENTAIVTRNEWKYVGDLETSLDETLPPIHCLPGGINQVLLNVIVNAAHAIEEKNQEVDKGKISITTQFEPPFVTITVTDTGCGISKENMHKIFDPFFTTKEVGKGTGQGLAIVYDIIVDKHGGSIDIETEEGQGTSFILRLPVKPDALVG